MHKFNFDYLQEKRNSTKIKKKRQITAQETKKRRKAV